MKASSPFEEEQSERFMDIMMHPLEAKVAALEGRQPVLDCNIAEPLERTWKILEAFGFEVTRQSERPARFHGDAGGRYSLSLFL